MILHIRQRECTRKFGAVLAHTGFARGPFKMKLVNSLVINFGSLSSNCVQTSDFVLDE